ncbi:MAG: VTT domain-containing protein [Fervidicoccaceae archaeon]
MEEDRKMLENIGSLVAQYGLLGVFLASFIGNAIPYSAVPYVAFILAYGAMYNVTNYLLLSLIGGGGATLGKIVIFLAARIGRKKMSKERKENVDYFLSLMKKKYFGFLLIILFALTPLPDDVIYVPLGIAGYTFLNFLVGVFIGKFFLVFLILLLGKSAYSILELSLNSHYVWIGIVFLLLATFYLILIVFYLDWKGVITTLSEKGTIQAIKQFIEEAVQIITFRHRNIRKKFLKNRVKN